MWAIRIDPGHGFETRGKEKKEKRKTADCIILHLSRHGNRLGPRRKSALVSIATQGKVRKRVRGREAGEKETEQNGRDVERDRGIGKTRRWEKDLECKGSAMSIRMHGACFNRVILAQPVE